MPVTLAEAYGGCVKTVRIDVPRVCDPCRGTGCKDPDTDAQSCAPCNGQGHVVHRAGPFVIGMGECAKCKGRGVAAPEPGRECARCGGGGSVRGLAHQTTFAFDVPRGMRDGHSQRFPGGGSFDARRRRHNDLVIVAALALPAGVDAVEASTGKISMTVPLPLEDLLRPGGFERDLGAPWGRRLRARSTGYFKPDGPPLVVRGAGMPATSQRATPGDLEVRFAVEFPTRRVGDGGGEDVASDVRVEFTDEA